MGEEMRIKVIWSLVTDEVNEDQGHELVADEVKNLIVDRINPSLRFDGL